MAKKLLFCDECEAEFTVNYKGKEQPQFCAFCGEEINLDWNSAEEQDE